MDEYKEYDLLPCPWCEKPVHVEVTSAGGYYITCGNEDCNCPARMVYYDKDKAIKRWNDGSDFAKIRSIWKEE